MQPVFEKVAFVIKEILKMLKLQIKKELFHNLYRAYSCKQPLSFQKWFLLTLRTGKYTKENTLRDKWSAGKHFHLRQKSGQDQV